MCQFLQTPLLLCLALATNVSAQETPNFPSAAPEHALLEQFLGVWTVTNECTMEPGAEPIAATGTLRGQMLGDRWVLNRIEMGAQPMLVSGVQTIGYDPTKSEYVGTWVDSMTNHLWVYSGTFDAESQTLTLNTTGPNLMGEGAMVRFRDIYRFIDDDHIESRSEAVGEDGTWVTFTTGKMHRAAE